MTKYYDDPATGQRVEIRKTHPIRNFVVLPAVAVIALVVVIVAATGGGGGQTASPNAPAAPVAQSTQLAFGETYEWSGGEAISVFTPYPSTSPMGAYDQAARLAAVDVTITNNTDGDLRASMVSLTAQHNGRAAQEDLTSDFFPQTVLPPGGDVTITKVYQVGSEPGELTISAQPSMFASTTVYYTGQF